MINMMNTTDQREVQRLTLLLNDWVDDKHGHLAPQPDPSK